MPGSSRSLTVLRFLAAAAALVPGAPVAAQSLGVRGAIAASAEWYDPVGGAVFLDLDVTPTVSVRLGYDRMTGSGERLSFCSPVLPACPDPVQIPETVTVQGASLGVPVALMQRSAASLHLIPSVWFTRDGYSGLGTQIGAELRVAPRSFGRLAAVIGADVGRVNRSAEELADGPPIAQAFSYARGYAGLRVRLR